MFGQTGNIDFKTRTMIIHEGFFIEIRDHDEGQENEGQDCEAGGSKGDNPKVINLPL